MNYKIKKHTQQHTHIPNHLHTIYPRIVNKADISFTANEENLLQKGLWYKLHKKPRNCNNTLAIEAENTVKRLPIQHQDSLRHLVARNIGHIYQ
jgi:hypothetical protein